MDYKTLLQRIQTVVGEFETSANDTTAVSALARTILRHFRRELGLTGARIYEQDGERYELVQRVGDAEDEEIGIYVPVDYPPIAAVLDTGIIVMEPNDPGVDPRSISAPGDSRRFPSASNVSAFSASMSHPGSAAKTFSFHSA
jgi:hypothetical protein